MCYIAAHDFVVIARIPQLLYTILAGTLTRLAYEVMVFKKLYGLQEAL